MNPGELSYFWYSKDTTIWKELQGKIGGNFSATGRKMGGSYAEVLFV